MIEIPEVDRGAWYSLSAAKSSILKSQQPFLDVLSMKVLNLRSGAETI
jgi:predicted NUDIX family NTP pyrophosphohydrolase